MAAQKKGSITLAPEAGSQRMRDVINKNHTEEELLELGARPRRARATPAPSSTSCAGCRARTTTTCARSSTWRTRRGSGRAPRATRTSASRSASRRTCPSRTRRSRGPSRSSTAELNRRLGVLREAARGKPVTLKYRDAETSLLEGVFTRGDRRLGAAVEDGVPPRLPLRRLERAPALRHLARGVPRSRHRSRALPDRALDRARAAVGRGAVAGDQEVPGAREACAPTRPAITEDCRLEDVCFSCGVVGVPAASVGQAAARPARPAARAPRQRRRRASRRPACGRRARSRRTNGRAATAARRGTTSTRFRIVFEKGGRDALHLASRPDAHLGAVACAAPGCRWRSPRGIIRTSRCRSGRRCRWAFVPGPKCSTSSSRSRPRVDLAERLNAVLPDGLSVLGVPAHPVQDALAHEPARRRVVPGAVPRTVPRGGRARRRTSCAGRSRRASPSCSAREHVIVRRAERGPDPRIRRPSLDRGARGRRARRGRPCWTRTLRFTVRAQARPDELVALLLPEADPRTRRRRARRRCGRSAAAAASIPSRCSARDT